MQVTANFVMKTVQSFGGHLQGLTYTETLPTGVELVLIKIHELELYA